MIMSSHSTITDSRILKIEHQASLHYVHEAAITMSLDDDDDDNNKKKSDEKRRTKKNQTSLKFQGLEILDGIGGPLRGIESGLGILDPTAEE